MATDVDEKAVLDWLKRQGSSAVRDGMARYAIPSDNAYGVRVGALRQYAKRLGHNHTLAAALWKTGRYEARLLATFLAEPARVTPAEMDRWCRDFDNWAVCDTACFHLFDRTPHAFDKVAQWSRRSEEFVRRGAFALLASVALHDKRADDDSFMRCLPLIESAADDDRNFVKKAVSWALRGVGRRNAALNAAALIVARRLSSLSAPAARWVGKDALKDLTSAAMQHRLMKLASQAKAKTRPAAKAIKSTTKATPLGSRRAQKAPGR